MNLFPQLEEAFGKDGFSAREAVTLAHIYSWGPVVFQVARLTRKYGILALLESNDGLTIEEIREKTGLSVYAVKCLMEASLTMRIVTVDVKSERFRLSKVGWFLLKDDLIAVDIDFNNDVNYEGWFFLDKSLEEGRPCGLEHFGSWSTIYEGLSSLPEQVQKSWFGFDHYYSDHSFDEAVDIIFNENENDGSTSSPTNENENDTLRYRNFRLLDVGGNTGKFARFVTEKFPRAWVTVCDLPQQIELLHNESRGHIGESRISGYGMNLLDKNAAFPTEEHYDAIWMSQFLDCFGEEEIVSILSRVAAIMDESNRLYIMETLWDRQKFGTAAFCLTMTSLYFTAMANGNSKMYNTDDMVRLIGRAGLEVERFCDDIGMGGHSVLIVKKPFDKLRVN